MARRFTRASSERINIGSAGLAGLNFQWGTIAVCAYDVTNPGAAAGMAYVGTNQFTGDLAYIGIGNNLADWYDGTTERVGSTAVEIAEPLVVVATKASGSATPRFHKYRFNTNTWLHENGDGANVDGATATSFTLGAEADSSPFAALDAEVWAIGIWPSRVMTDSECERLARGNWLNYGPAFYEQWTDGREVGDMVTTLGRNRSRQTSRTGTTRGAQKPPPGFRMDARRRRR